ncbi:MAG TPA: universal stress protein [Pseudonocardia sp.]|jgi:nucleotide-binding universal stress UspA family protein|nr:universal stress protein [Pseudonocardia sp.]
MPSGPILIGFDGTSAAERAVWEAGRLFAPRPAVVLVVLVPGEAFAAVVGPLAGAGIPLTEVEIQAALEYEEKAMTTARQLAEKGAAMAREAGLEAEGRVVADDAGVPRTLLRVADERDASAIVLGSRRHRTLSEFLLGSTTRDVLKRARRPVVAVPDVSDDR